jgi:MFS family permease
LTSPFTRDAAQPRFLVLIAILFISYLCVAIPLPVVPVHVTQRLGFANAWAGLAVGAAFLSTIVSRGWAGRLTDRRGAKGAAMRGLSLYAGGASLCLAAGLSILSPLAAFVVLLVGRLLVGVGESLVGVSVIGWGIGLVGPSRSGKVLAWVGASIYGALAIGGPVGLVLYQQVGFAWTMVVSALLPCIGLLAIGMLTGIEPHPEAERPSYWSVIGTIWWYGLIVCLQGIGFAAIGAFFVLYFLHENWPLAGLGFTAFGGGFVLMRLFFGNFPDRFGGLPVAIVSLAIETVGQLLIWSANDPALALAGAFLTGLGCSMIFPAMGREVVHLVPPHLRATALGGFSAFQDLAYGMTGPLAGLLADRTGYGNVFLVGGVAAASGFGIALALRQRMLARQ